MAAVSGIEWTDRTWNPVRGCSIVSPGCVNCYAMKFAHRFSGPGKPYEGLTKQTKSGPQWTGDIRTVEDALIEPIRWKKPSRIFVNSMSDLFHEGVPDEFIDRVFAVTALAPRHTFQILTKRSRRMFEYVSGRRFTADQKAILQRGNGECVYAAWPAPNVWLGFSGEDQPRFDERWADVSLLASSGWTTFASLEPLIAPIELPQQQLEFTPAGSPLWPPPAQPKGPIALPHKDWPDDFGYWQARRNGLSWVIVGGESGPGARACDVAWVRSIVGQCNTASVPVFVKQLGAYPTTLCPVCEGKGTNASFIPGKEFGAETFCGRCMGCHRQSVLLNDNKGGDPSEWPEDLRVREFPATEAQP